jgi:hypothetical protein
MQVVLTGVGDVDADVNTMIEQIEAFPGFAHG